MMMLSVRYDTGDIHNNDQDHDDYNDDDDVVYYRYLHFSLGEGSLVFADLLVLFLIAQPVGNISSSQSCKNHYCLACRQYLFCSDLPKIVIAQSVGNISFS